MEWTNRDLQFDVRKIYEVYEDLPITLNEAIFGSHNDESFSAAAPALWNILLPEVRLVSLLLTFQRSFKSVCAIRPGVARGWLNY